MQRVDLLMQLSDLIQFNGFDAVYDAVVLIGGENNERTIPVGMFVLSNNQYTAIKDLLENEQKIQAIKLYRAFTCCTLKYAKYAIENTCW